MMSNSVFYGLKGNHFFCVHSIQSLISFHSYRIDVNVWKPFNYRLVILLVLFPDFWRRQVVVRAHWDLARMILRQFCHAPIRWFTFTQYRFGLQYFSGHKVWCTVAIILEMTLNKHRTYCIIRLSSSVLSWSVFYGLHNVQVSAQMPSPRLKRVYWFVTFCFSKLCLSLFSKIKRKSFFLCFSSFLLAFDSDVV